MATADADADADAVFERVKQEYMPRIYQEIRLMAERKSPGGLHTADVFRAFEEYFAGLPRRPHSAWGFVQDNIFLLSAIFLTLVFGAFGLYHGDEQEVSSFLDIAKIFAGAVVGGAAGSTAVAISRRRPGSQPK